jgi:putative transposase
MLISPNDILLLNEPPSTEFENKATGESKTAELGEESLPEVRLEELERVLHIDGSRVYVINLSGKQRVPSMRKLEDIEKAMDEHKISLFRSEPFSEHLQPNDWTEESREIREKRRDQNLKLIKPVLELKGGMYIPAERGPVIKRTAKIFKVTKKWVYDLMQNWWIFGMVANAVMPWIFRKTYTERPRKPGDPPSKKKGRYSSEELQQGFRGPPITLAMRFEFEWALKTYYFNKNVKHKSLWKAFKRMLARFYSDGLEKDPDRPGGKRVKFIHKSMRPTWRQLENYFYTRYKLKKVRIAMMPDRDYNLKNRPIEGNATLREYGPGSCFEMDATPLPVIVVDENGNPLGKATLYLVVDVFSHLIVGFYIGLEKGSFAAAALAMYNAASDKVEFCRQYEFEIIEAEWPAHHLPDKGYADRALKGLMAVGWVRRLMGWFENAPPYRPDMKPFVERLMQLLDEFRLADAPGATQKMAKRGDKDPKADARLTSYDLNQIAIQTILEYNNKPIKKYPSEAFQIPDEVGLWPSSLFTYGLRSRTRLKTQNGNILKANLLPIAKVKSDRGGINFRGVRFLPQVAFRQVWQTKTSRHPNSEFEISYFPNLVDAVYVRIQGREPVPFFLAVEFKHLKGKTWAEAAAAQRAKNAKHITARRNHEEYSANRDLAIQNIIKRARNRRYDGGQDLKKHQVRKNRDIAVRKERANNPLLPKERMTNGSLCDAKNDEPYIPPHDPTQDE